MTTERCRCARTERASRSAGHDLDHRQQWEAAAEVREDGTLAAVQLDADPRSTVVHMEAMGLSHLATRTVATSSRPSTRRSWEDGRSSSASTAVEPGNGALTVRGQLELRQDEVPVSSHRGGRRPRAWDAARNPERVGDQALSGDGGALKVRDTVEVILDAAGRGCDLRARDAADRGGQRLAEDPGRSIHGLLAAAQQLGNRAQLVEEAGYAALTPGWPDDPETVEEARANPDVFAKKTSGQIADHTAEVIGKLDKEPAVMGHSTGGLVAQMIADRGLSAAMAIAPGPFRGVLLIPISALRSAMPVLKNPVNRGRAVTLSLDEFSLLDERSARTKRSSSTRPTTWPPSGWR